MQEWDLREEILTQTQRWYLIVAVFLLGSLLGWGVGTLWPSPYRATAELYVGLEAYRVATDRYVSSFTEAEITNPDDYKNWQIGQLNALVTSRGYSHEVLRRLQEDDPYWNDFGIEELQGMQRVYWRNPGLWQLVFETSDPDRALQGVRVWEAVTLERVNRTISHANTVMVLDSKLQSLIDAQTQTHARSAEVNMLKNSLLDVYPALSDLPEDEPLPTSKREELRILAAQGVEISVLTGRSTNDELPTEDAFPKDYRKWVDSFVLAAEKTIDDLDAQINVFEQEIQEISSAYADEAKAAHGLTVNLTVESLSESSPSVTQIRPKGLAALVGGLISVCVWVLAILVRINKQAKS